MYSYSPGEAKALVVVGELAPELLTGLGGACCEPAYPWKADLPGYAVATDEKDIKLCTGDGGVYCQDPRDSNFPWIAEPEQKLKGARSECGWMARGAPVAMGLLMSTCSAKWRRLRLLPWT